MSQKTTILASYRVPFTLFLLIILTFGVFISVNQTQTPQNSNSHAASNIVTTSPLTPLNTSVPTLTVEPTNTPVIAADMVVIVAVKIAGIGQNGNLHPQHKTRRVKALIYGIGTNPVTTGTAFLTYDGSNFFTGPIHLGKLSEGSYFIKLVSDKTLQALAKPEFQTLLINKTNTIPPVSLYQGDMNGDNVLNLDDYNFILPCFQNTACETAGTIDFNDDGKTDVSDYNLLLQSFVVMHGS